MAAPLSELLTKALHTDAQARARLRAMGPCRVRLAIAPAPAFGLAVAADGAVRLAAPEDDAELGIEGHLGAFARYALTGRADDIRFAGEAELARRFRELLAGLDLDWEELAAGAVGDAAARLLGRGAGEFARAARQAGRAAEDNARDYLRRESGLLPERAELERFLREVDRLRDDLERLAQRLDRAAP